MKNKLSILLLFLCLNTVAQVPNTSTFALSDVVAITGGTSLQAAFTNSVDSIFDPAYKGSKNSLLNFRNYGGPRVGGWYMGGYIFYMLAGHGLIVNAYDLGNVYWHATNDGNVVTIDRTLPIPSGSINTVNIIIAYGVEDNAAKRCSDLVINGYSDWYLPSSTELRGLLTAANSGYDFHLTYNTLYWSSYQDPNGYTSAYAHKYPYNQTTYSLLKSTTYHLGTQYYTNVRAIRAFTY
jgi:hypothetical protein